jgi:hypothetical protein
MLSKRSTKSAMLQRCKWNESLTFLVAKWMDFMAPQSTAGQKYTPPEVAGSSSSCPTQDSQGTGARPTLNSQQNPAQATNQVTGPGISTNKGQEALPSDLRILFGVKGSHAALKLEQIKIRDTTNDIDFYDQLKKHYRLNRGRLRYWLSIWRLGYCEVVKARHNPCRGRQ